MKKLFFLVFVSVFVLSGCGKPKVPRERIMECTRNEEKNGVKMDFVYRITYKGDNVLRVNNKEIVVTDNEEIMTYIYDEVQKLVDKFEGVEGYDVTLSLDGNTMTNISNIDYEIVDFDKLIEMDSSTKLLLTDGKIKIYTIRSTYEAMGNVCEEK